MDSKILQNALQCLTCEEYVVSMGRHDYRGCECGDVSVDGGFDYLKQRTPPKAAFESMYLNYLDPIDEIYDKYLIVDKSKWIRFKDASDEAVDSWGGIISYSDFLPVWAKLIERRNDGQSSR